MAVTKINTKRTSTYKLTKNPLEGLTLVLSEKAYKKMTVLASITKSEVSWLGSIREEPNNVRVLEDIYIFEQECTSVITELEAGITKFWVDNAANIPLLNSIKLWGHSHHSMPASPSGTDDRQMKAFEAYDIEYMFMLIINNKGDYTIEMVHNDLGIYVSDVPLLLESSLVNEYEEAMKAEFSEKVKDLHSNVVGYIGSGYEGYNAYDYYDGYRGYPYKGHTTYKAGEKTPSAKATKNALTGKTKQVSLVSKLFKDTQESDLAQAFSCTWDLLFGFTEELDIATFEDLEALTELERSMLFNGVIEELMLMGYDFSEADMQTGSKLSKAKNSYLIRLRSIAESYEIAGTVIEEMLEANKEEVK